MSEFWEKVFLAAFEVRCRIDTLDGAVNLAAMAANRAVRECPGEDVVKPCPVEATCDDLSLSELGRLLRDVELRLGATSYPATAVREILAKRWDQFGWLPKPPEECRSLWISVKDKLPDVSGDVLIYLPVQGPVPAKLVAVMGLAYYSQRRACFTRCTIASRLTADAYWMPLPEPPEDAP